MPPRSSRSTTKRSDLAMPEICICIATYRRPEGLDRLLRSLAGLAPDTPEFEVIVVDNDVDRTADPVVRGAVNDRFALRHLWEPERNISKARNCGVRAAQCKFVAFIDDDEAAAPDWLLNLHRGLIADGGDAAFGPVIPRFGGTPPRWISELGFYVDRTPPTGTELPWHDATTGNVLVRYQAMEALEGLFDEQLGSEGGEDVDLFARLADNGARLISVEDAFVYEDIPPARLTWSWMVRRYLRNGIIIQRIAGRRQSRRQRCGFSLTAGWKSCTSLTRAAVGGMRSRRKGIRELFRAVEYLGVVGGFLGLRMREYDRPR
jgi:succinoglycan biosynthesis protein ExoM